MLGQVGEAGPLLLLFPCWIWLWEGGFCACVVLPRDFMHGEGGTREWNR